MGTNEPVVGVVVRANKRGGGSTFFMMGEKAGKEMTDEQGRYVLEDAPTGKLMLRSAPANFTEFGSVHYGDLSVVAESGTVLEAPDMLIPPKRVKRGEARGDLGFKIKQKDLGEEDENPPRAVGFIRPGGPAVDSGLEVGDIITKVDGHAVDGAQPGLYSSLTEVPPGAKVELTLERGETVTIVAGDPV